MLFVFEGVGLGQNVEPLLFSNNVGLRNDSFERTLLSHLLDVRDVVEFFLRQRRRLRDGSRSRCWSVLGLFMSRSEKR